MRKKNIDITATRAKQHIQEYEAQIKDLQLKIEALKMLLVEEKKREDGERPSGFELIPILESVLLDRSGDWVRLDEIVSLVKEHPEAYGYCPDKKIVRSTLNYQIKKPHSIIERDETRKGFYRSKPQMQEDTGEMRVEDIPF